MGRLTRIMNSAFVEILYRISGVCMHVLLRFESFLLKNLIQLPQRYSVRSCSVNCDESYSFWSDALQMNMPKF